MEKQDEKDALRKMRAAEHAETLVSGNLDQKLLFILQNDGILQNE